MLKILLIGVALTACVSCTLKSKEPSVAKGHVIFEDHFDRSSPGSAWLDTSPEKYTIKNGKLRAKGARNKPLWLKKKLPQNVRVEFTAKSVSPSVDIKVEIFGDGKSFAKSLSYTATSYVLILGGWNNSRSIIARMDEHKDDRKVRKNPVGKAGKEYKFSIVRKGSVIEWSLDNKPFLKFDDSKPLTGPGHEYFAFNNWESEVYFDDIVVYEL